MDGFLAPRSDHSTRNNKHGKHFCNRVFCLAAPKTLTQKANINENPIAAAFAAFALSLPTQTKTVTFVRQFNLTLLFCQLFGKSFLVGLTVCVCLLPLGEKEPTPKYNPNSKQHTQVITMSSGTRSKRSASTGGEQEPLLKKMKPHDDHDPEAGEPIPVEQAAAAEGMLAGERVPLASTPKQEPEQQQLVAPPMTPMTTGAAQTPHTAGTGGEPPETPLTGAGGVSNKRGLASQIDLSNKTPTDPTAFNDYLFALIAHKAENNNFHVSREENPSLHVWMQHLKREYKNYLSEEVGSTLTPVQVMVLESLHVPLTSRGDDHWNRFYQLLLQVCFCKCLT